MRIYQNPYPYQSNCRIQGSMNPYRTHHLGKYIGVLTRRLEKDRHRLRARIIAKRVREYSFLAFLYKENFLDAIGIGFKDSHRAGRS